MKKKYISIAFAIAAIIIVGCTSQNDENTIRESDTQTEVWTDAQTEPVDTQLETQAVVEMPADGTYTANVSLEGGTGRVSITSPAQITIENGYIYATVEWSSTHYDYMIVNKEKYLNENEGGNSTFTIPLPSLPCVISVIGDTTAMSEPHEIEYTFTFDNILQ